MTPVNNEWPWNRAPLETGGALYHFPSALRAYGDFTAYDMSSALGVLKFVVDFVNRKPESYKSGTTQILPTGRERLRKLLQLATHGPTSLGDLDLSNPTDEAMDEIRQLAGRIRREHRLERMSDGAQWRDHAFIRDADEFYAVVATMLMSAKLRAKVAQCRRPECSEFFIVEKSTKGRPPLYHDKECTRLANEATADVRQRNLRKRNAAAKSLKGQSASANNIKVAIKQAFRDDPDATVEQLVKSAKVIIKVGKKHK